MNTFVIDVDSAKDGKKVKRRLKRLASTISVEGPFNYVFGTVQRECQVIVETTKTEEELENWLYSTKGINYIGVCPK